MISFVGNLCSKITLKYVKCMYKILFIGHGSLLVALEIATMLKFEGLKKTKDCL